MSADAIDAIARMMSESRCRGKFRGRGASPWGHSLDTLGDSTLERLAEPVVDVERSPDTACSAPRARSLE